MEKLDMFLNKRLRGNFISFPRELLVVSSIFTIGFFIFGFFLSVLFFICDLMSLSLCFIGIGSVIGRKIVFLDDEILILKYKSQKVLYKIPVYSVKKVQVKFSISAGTIFVDNMIECIVSFLQEDKLEYPPDFRRYCKNKNYLFIENRAGLEELISKYALIEKSFIEAI